jgi:hypothetical protein
MRAYLSLSPLLLVLVAGCASGGSNGQPPLDLSHAERPQPGPPNDLAMSDQAMSLDLAVPEIPDLSVAASGDMAAICRTPSTLHPPASGARYTLFCPFGATDGGPLYCDPSTTHCCEPPTGFTSTCQPTAGSCNNVDTDWQCADPVADCPSGQVCCGTGVLMKNTDPNCANYANNFTGTHCAAQWVPVKLLA